MTVLLSSAAVVVLALAATGVVARRTGRIAVIDVTWGLLFVLIAWVALAVGRGSSRSWLLAVLTSLWGLRLAAYLAARSRGRGEDWRYTAMLARVPMADRWRYAVSRVFVAQGAVAWFVALPIQVAAVTTRPLGWLAGLGVAVWLVGLAFETVGDAQLRAFTADPANRGRIMDRGLWAWTRHPNYVGDAAVWWGLWLVSAEAWPGVLTVLSPVLMTCLLVAGTGARLMESRLMTRPGYAAYAARTSGFLPRPPRREP